jgi:hypothetical protein
LANEAVDQTNVIVGRLPQTRPVIRDREHMGELDLGELPRRWRLLESLYETYAVVQGARDHSVLHARMIDEAQVAGHRVYMAAERLLGLAWDNHAALLALLQHHGATQWAPWNLLRPTFEASFHVLWVLEPQSSLERRQRGLRLEYLDEIETQKYRKGLAGIRDHISPTELPDYEEELARAAVIQGEHERTYRAEANVLGMHWPPVGLNVTQALGALASNAEMPGSALLLETTWRTLSGMQHGRASALVRVTDRSDEAPSRGGVTAKFTIKDEAFVSAASITNSLHMQALALLIERSRP